MTDLSKKVETHFHKTYKSFDSFYGKKNPISRKIDQLFRESMHLRFEKVIESIAPYEEKTVLDVGCGAGRYCFALAERGIKSAVGIDFAKNMIDEAKRIAIHLGYGNICIFQQNDFMKMNFEKPFDHVFAMGVLDYIAEPVPFIKKMAESASKSVMISFPSKGGFVQFLRRQLFWYIKKCPVYFYDMKDIVRITDECEICKCTIDRMGKDFFLTIKK